MPARRAYTAAELAERLERQREQTRQRVARWRAKQQVTVTDGRNGHAVTVTTAALPAREDVPVQGVLSSKEESYPLASQGKRGSGGGTGAPKPNKSGELMDRLRAAGVEFEFLEKHHAALKRTRLSAAQVAEVWIAITEGRFGDAWLCDHVNVERAIAAWPNYQNRKTRGPRPTRGESASARAERMFAEALSGGA